jgi:hypothetical protein
MLKVHFLATCLHCNGESYPPIGEAEDSQCHNLILSIPEFPAVLYGSVVSLILY